MIRLSPQFLVWLLRVLWPRWLLALPRPLRTRLRVMCSSNIRVNTEVNTQGSRTAASGQLQTKVAWCVLALGLVGSPGLVLRPGPFGKKGPLAFTLLGPSCTPRMLPPHPGDTSSTRSTSMILLTGRSPLPRALSPVMGRREAVTCVAQPWVSETHPSIPAQTPRASPRVITLVTPPLARYSG